MDALTTFLNYYRIPSAGSPRELLGKVVAAFARLPYENITKIIKHAETGNPIKARRYPDEVIRNHVDWGTGGTCFSLTSALRQLVHGLGWRAEYILADRRYGLDTHCALLIWIDDVPHLLDPGFLIVNPIHVAELKQGIETGFNRLMLEPEGRNRIALSTVRQNSKAYRLTYKLEPVDEGQFLRAWDASFDWDMMQYPLLTRTAESGQIYLRGSRLQISSAGSVESRHIEKADLVAGISGEFRIQPALVARALSILKSGG